MFISLELAPMKGAFHRRDFASSRLLRITSNRRTSSRIDFVPSSLAPMEGAFYRREERYNDLTRREVDSRIADGRRLPSTRREVERMNNTRSRADGRRLPSARGEVGRLFEMRRSADGRRLPSARGEMRRLFEMRSSRDDAKSRRWKAPSIGARASRRKMKKGTYKGKKEDIMTLVVDP